MRRSFIIPVFLVVCGALGVGLLVARSRPPNAVRAPEKGVEPVPQGQPTASPPPESPSAAALRQLIECEHRARNEEARRRWHILMDFYRRRSHEPAWSTEAGLSTAATDLLAAIAAAQQHAMNPDDYRMPADMGLALAGAGTPELARARRDVALTELFINYTCDLSRGRVIHPDFFPANEPDVGAALDAALAQHRLPDALQQLGPHHAGYARLLSAVLAYRSLAARGELPGVPYGPVLKKGERDPRVVGLRGRLVAFGDLSPQAPRDPGRHADQLFDHAVEAAVRNFQRRHGLAPDGQAGAATLAELNVPVLDRARQLELNLERWRWLPADLGARYVLVNIPDYELRVIETTGRGETSVLEMRVVVGVTEQPTPGLSATISHLILNPFWNIPGKIAEREMLPELAKDPAYLAKKQIQVVRRGEDHRPVDPRKVNWRNPAWRQQYRLRQQPGPGNAMGQLKFVLRNPFGVYLHDTPKHQLFAQRKRAGSHGCIRVERPDDLAAYLLAGSAWSDEAISAALATGANRRIDLPEQIPVHLVYFTAWVGDDGTVEFRDDVYGEDAALDTALRTEVGSLHLRACLQTTQGPPPPKGTAAR